MKSITTKQLKDVIDKNKENFLIIDVRSKDQHETCTIKGAKNITADDIRSNLEKYKQYDHLYLHCNRGGGSSRTCRSLEAAGLSNAVNVEGGLKAWVEAGFEVECKK